VRRRETGREKREKRLASPPSLSSLLIFLYFPAPLQVNYNLLTVNAFMAMTGLYQLSRKFGLVGAGGEEKGAAAGGGEKPAV